MSHASRYTQDCNSAPLAERFKSHKQNVRSTDPRPTLL
jgi:hypothetical protein